MKCGNSNEVIHKDVVIIGNGPSGITLSYMLSGNIPYVISNSHPDEFLSARLATVLDKSLIQEDLEYLSGGLEGRTTNPVSLLIDNLMHPCADIGLELEPLVEWRNDGYEFQKFGHHCEIQKTIRDFKLDKRKKFAYRISLKFKQLFVINETNRRGYNFLRSQKKMENEFRKQLLHPLTIHPFSDFRKYWELFMSIILLIQMYTLTLHLAVCNMKLGESFLHSNAFINCRLFIDAISLLDMLLSFISGYCNEKDSTIILEPRKIISHYLGSGFIMDLLCTIPTDMIVEGFNEIVVGDEFNNENIVFILNLFALIKLCRYVIVVKYINNIFEVTGTSYLLYRIFIVSISFITYIHVLACISMAWTGWENPWSEELHDSMLIIKSYGPNVDSFSVMYIHFFYGTSLMILTAGYRLVTYSDSSLMFVVNVWVLSRIIFILTLSYFMELYTVQQSSSQKYIDIVDEIKDCMKHKHIPDFLRRRILAYYDVKYQNYYFQESEILNTVSGQLRQEIVMNTCRKLVENVVFFKNLPIALLVRIVSCLRYEIYLTNDVIAKAGTPGDSMYFISNGTVAVYTKNGKEICHLQDGDHFGEVALVMKEMNRIASVVAVEVCELYRLEKRDFIRAILPYPDLIDKIINVAGERMERTDIMNEVTRHQASYKLARTSSHSSF